MGILNVTPDSFSDGGRYASVGAALDHAHRMIDEGADMIDIGGESTRPGHAEVDSQTELARIIPVLEALVPAITVPVSIDTTKAAVAEGALSRGATIINDVWGLHREPDIACVAASQGAELVVMHNREAIEPQIDIMADVLAFFERALATARKAGVADEKIILDPGFGFGKTPAQNLEVVRRLGELRQLGFPVLLGVSRKSTIGLLTRRPVEERLIGTVTMHAWAMREGVDIVRVHDVAAHVDARTIVEALA